MRVSNNLMINTVSGNLFRNTERLLKIQNMISSGKRINKPSDDPVGIGKVLDCRKTISSIDQYGRNIAHGTSWASLSDASLGSINSLLVRAKEIAEYQATETSTPVTREIAAQEVMNIFDQIMQQANTKLGNSYIFAGHSTDSAPFTRDDDYNASYNGNTGDIGIKVGENIEININATGLDIFDNDINTFDVLKNLIDGLEADDTALISEQLESIDDALNQLLNVRAEFGAKLNRLESTQNHWNNVKFNVEEMLSKTEDADFTKAMTDLIAQETAYQASLAASARIIQPSLINFLV